MDYWCVASSCVFVWNHPHTSEVETIYQRFTSDLPAYLFFRFPPHRAYFLLFWLFLSWVKSPPEWLALDASNFWTQVIWFLAFHNVWEVPMMILRRSCRSSCARSGAGIFRASSYRSAPAASSEREKVSIDKSARKSLKISWQLFCLACKLVASKLDKI